MSRTDKDIPYRVLAMDAYKAGSISHNHSRNSNVHTVTEKVSFMKRDSAEIHKFRSELVASGVSFSEEEVVSTHYIMDENVGYPRAKVKKEIVFKVEKSVKGYYSEYCTDYENFDSVSVRDRRDGKVVNCFPIIKHSDNRYTKCNCCNHSYHRGNKKSKKNKSKKNKSKNSFNSGVDYKDLPF